MPGPVFLDGDDVTLHPATEDDLGFLARNRNDPRVRATRSVQYPASSADLQQYLGGRLGRNDDTIALVVVRDDERVGLVHLIREQPNDRPFDRAELAYWIDPAHQGDGNATDAASVIVGHAFDRLGLHKVVAKTYASNPASRRVLEKLGFEREGTFRDEAYVDGDWVDVHRYGLLDANWRTNG
jgi:RimJ/RimL family protein N-acetyltransferase